MIVIAINTTWKLAPWAAALYACDLRWWRTFAPSLEEFPGLRFIGEAKTRFADCIECHVKPGDNRLSWDGEHLGAGGNSGFQAINLAAVAGCARIVLTGFDMGRTEGKSHWHGDHGGPIGNPGEAMLERCAKLLDSKAREFREHGVEILNASRVSALKAFPRVSIEEALA